MSTFAEHPAIRWIAALIASIVLFTTVMVAPKAALATTGAAANTATAQQTQVPAGPLVEERGKVKITAKAAAKLVRKKAKAINRAIRRAVNALPIKKSWKKKLIATISAGKIAGLLDKMVGVTDTIQGHLQRAIDRIPGVPTWLAKRVASVIAWIAF